MVSKNVLVDMKMQQIENNYAIDRNAPLPSSITEGSPQWHGVTNTNYPHTRENILTSYLTKGYEQKMKTT